MTTTNPNIPQFFAGLNIKNVLGVIKFVVKNHVTGNKQFKFKGVPFFK